MARCSRTPRRRRCRSGRHDGDEFERLLILVGGLERRSSCQVKGIRLWDFDLAMLSEADTSMYFCVDAEVSSPDASVVLIRRCGYVDG
jgi:hypothetical protein